MSESICLSFIYITFIKLAIFSIDVERSLTSKDKSWIFANKKSKVHGCIFLSNLV